MRLLARLSWLFVFALILGVGLGRNIYSYASALSLGCLLVPQEFMY